MTGCLAENTLVEFVEGQLSAEATENLHKHVDECDVCRKLLAEVAGAFPLSTEKDRNQAPSSSSAPSPSARSWSLRVTQPSAIQLLKHARDPTPHPREVRLAPGDRVGNYRVVRQLALGGMGAVFEAVHEQIRSRVALKVLYPHYSDNPQMVARFFNEARAVNIVRHPSIVSSFEVGHLPSGAAKGSAYMVMEYLDGESLGGRLRRLNGRLGPDTLRITRQIASALVAAHGWGVIHRDLKPGNVMIVPDPEMAGGERVKILDFGLAKVAAELSDLSEIVENGYSTYAGAILGTPAYMAPEQCQEAGGVDEKADVYSLGVMLYECLSGILPFSAKGAVDLMAMHIYVPPPPLIDLAPETPHELVELVHAMLHKRPEERPTMEEVAVELDRLDSLHGSGARSGESTTGRFSASRAIVRAETMSRELAVTHDSKDSRPSRPSRPSGASSGIPPVDTKVGRLGRRLMTGLVAGLALVGLVNLGQAIFRPATRIVRDSEPQRVPSIPPRMGTVFPQPGTDLVSTLPSAGANLAPDTETGLDPQGTPVKAEEPSPQAGKPRQASRKPAKKQRTIASQETSHSPKPEWTDEKIRIFH